uniref:Cyclase family protein n=1 Tax=uncultured marine thaumarchaeote KM3_158_B05 TaxID=1456024 RepID=A0A075GLM6_9ARCH|nr:Cyclase family protein [uncultured marine thaumarchaeote KM3_158_B05]
MKVLDLTLTISEKIPAFPGSPHPHFIPWEKIKDDDYNLELLFLSTHTGTHMDAPHHFLEKGTKIHEISLKKLVSETVLIKTRKKSNESVTKTDIQKFEKKHGKIKGFSSVIFYTGWQRNLQKKYYFTKNPGLSVSAAKYLASKKVSLVGIDSPSIDLGIDSKFSVHQIFAKKGMLIVENLANLDKIKSSKFHLIVLPLKLKNATGSPVRAVAFVDLIRKIRKHS